MVSVRNQQAVTIRIPPYICSWEVDDEINRAYTKMKQGNIVYCIDLQGVHNIYSATIRLIMRLYDRAKRLGGQIRIVNAEESVMITLCALHINDRIPINQPFSSILN